MDVWYGSFRSFLYGDTHTYQLAKDVFLQFLRFVARVFVQLWRPKSDRLDRGLET